jgi:hypothetical protein
MNDTHKNLLLYITKCLAAVSVTRMAKASFTPVGNSADSPQPILRPSPVTGLDPNIVDVEKPYVGYDAETCLYQPP